jgi:hypothetical protein
MFTNSLIDENAVATDVRPGWCLTAGRVRSLA